MNPFEHYGIKHLSVSSLNLWAAEPTLWIMERLLDKKTPPSAPMHRGNAVEAGVVAALKGASFEEAIGIAYTRFAKDAAMSPNRGKEEAGIRGMVYQGYELLKSFGPPDRTQQRKEWQMEGVLVPMLGFSDLEYDRHGLVIDIKTTFRLHSEIQVSHARQVASYLGAGSNMRGGVAYVTDKRNACYQVENPAEHVKSLTRIALSLQRFLAVSKDPNELASLLSPDVDSFYYKGDQRTRQAAFEVYGV